MTRVDGAVTHISLPHTCILCCCKGGSQAPTLPACPSGSKQVTLICSTSCVSHHVYREKETQYLVRTLVQNLRVGAGWRSVVPALARASVLTREGRHTSKARQDQAATAAGAAFHLCPSLEVLVPALLEEGVDGLEKRCALTPGKCPQAQLLCCILVEY